MYIYINFCCTYFYLYLASNGRKNSNKKPFTEGWRKREITQFGVGVLFASCLGSAKWTKNWQNTLKPNCIWKGGRGGGKLSHATKKIIFFLTMGKAKQRHGSKCTLPPFNSIFYPNNIRVKQIIYIWGKCTKNPPFPAVVCTIFMLYIYRLCRYIYSLTVLQPFCFQM